MVMRRGVVVIMVVLVLLGRLLASSFGALLEVRGEPDKERRGGKPGKEREHLLG